ADEAQGQMIVLGVDPARAGQSAAQQGEGKRGIARNLEGGEKTRHDQTSFLIERAGLSGSPIAEGGKRFRRRCTGRFSLGTDAAALRAGSACRLHVGGDY